MRLVKGLLQRCIEVVEILAGDPAPVRLSDIAQRLDMPKSAAHRLLQELCAQGWVAQEDAEGRYRLTLRFALLGHAVLRASGLPELVQPVLEQLAAETRELVRLTLATERGLAWFASAQGAPPGLMYQPDMDGAVVLHATANGKAFLASLPPAQALALAQEGGLGRLRPTARTLGDAAALQADLARIRARGYALADEEAEPGVAAVSVVVRAGAAPALGTLSVAGPALRFGPQRVVELAARLATAAATLAGAWPRQQRTGKVNQA